MGHDPTIGSPAWVATQAGPFLTKHRQNTDSRSYKDGLSAAKPIGDLKGDGFRFAQPILHIKA
ncbi:MAG TPA: hypothetical protein VNZ48_17460 [Xanthobacteraceae bacterium]|nr:hypothetical protein [Xanthobacteraceae bacterium]